RGDGSKPFGDPLRGHGICSFAWMSCRADSDPKPPGGSGLSTCRRMGRRRIDNLASVRPRGPRRIRLNPPAATATPSRPLGGTMPAPALPSLADGESFYVIVGSAGAGLTGLMFVVVALGAEARTPTRSMWRRAFASPPVLHFCAVLLLAAILSTPGHTVASLQACVLACAVGGFGYSSVVIVRARRQEAYQPVLSDWVWHNCLPVLAYLSLLLAGVLLGRSPEQALYIVGGVALLLLFIGIHNAWDSAVWLTPPREGSWRQRKPAVARGSARGATAAGDDEQPTEDQERRSRLGNRLRRPDRRVHGGYVEGRPSVARRNRGIR